MKYVYPAVFEKEGNGGYSVSFPDLEGAFTCGKDLAEALFMAEDCLGLVLYGFQEDKEEFPAPSDIVNFKNTRDKFTSLISVDMKEYRKRVDSKPVRKTLYIPKNLNEQAEAIGINFSEVLRHALQRRVQV